MQDHQINNDLLAFLKTSPTPYHATDNIKNMLIKQGFIVLHETDSWIIKPNTGYIVIRHSSSIIAFTTGDMQFEKQGFRMIGAHTDSPCLKIRPHADYIKNQAIQLGVEVYGGALLSPWFDRDLSIAGQITWHQNNQIYQTLIDFKEPIAIIPSLAIHLDSTQNHARSINPQQHILPILNTQSTHLNDTYLTFSDTILFLLKEQAINIPKNTQLAYDLSLYDTQPAACIGLTQAFIASARLDNLVSCFIGTRALLDTMHESNPCLLACYDHEEVGSVSASGAQSPFLSQILERLLPDPQAKIQAIQRSLFISSDNAHAIHPNFPEKHDAAHAPVINQGLVIKINANQRYATSPESHAYFKNLCDTHDIPTQYFTARADQSCGSTIGPITAAELGIRTIDIGIPTYAMHSIREIAGTHDIIYLLKAFHQFYKTPATQLTLHTSS
ncbi:MAG: M18 family aminopeptidase [Endozoicomonadaceae bacterium]|nr:M18 family aminopeptidase [Endozoicomonadaceae bacterium]MBE8232445.1 M18 family aminopeptidase [Endozoicomonadaceae bacterium]